MYRVPILITLFNRPDHTEKLILTLNNINPEKIYIFIDGPRKNNEQDIINCNKVFEITKKINSYTNVLRKKSEKNLGCKEAVSTALNWFFSNEKSGIILEDDCLPNNDFFKFCFWGLNKFESQSQIAGITGNNFLNDKIFLKESFYYSKYAHCWGWATWKRVWEKYDKNMSFWNEYKLSNDWVNFFEKNIEKRYWTKILNNVFNGKIDSWAYPWNLCLWKEKKMIITPSVNLVENIGFGKEATHTDGINQNFSYKVSKLPEPYDLPQDFKINKAADNFVFNHHFRGKNYLWPYRLLYLIFLFFKNPYNFCNKVLKTVLSK